LPCVVVSNPRASGDDPAKAAAEHFDVS